MKKTLTSREEDTLRYIIQFKSVNGYSPTVREIANGINTKSTSHVRDMIARLNELGYISEKPNSPRTINVLKFL